MKKTFFYLLACILPAIALTSCSSDDDDPSTKYAWNLQQSLKEEYEQSNGKSSPTYTWLKEEISKLDKNYSGSGSFDSDDKALAKYDAGSKALKDLYDSFTKRMKTHDACGLSFDVSYYFQIKKGSTVLKKSPDYKFAYDRTSEFTRVEADETVELDLLKKFKDSKKLVNDKVVDCSKLGLMDGASMILNLDEKNIRVVDASSYEFKEGNPFVKAEIRDKEDAKGHELVLSYDFDEATYKNWQGKWYLLLPIRIISGQDSMTFNVKLNVNVK